MDAQGMIDILEDHGFEDTSITRKVEVIQDAVWEIEAAEPWPFLEARASVATASDGSVTKPSDWRSTLNFFDGTKKVRIRNVREDDVRDYGEGDLSETGDPVAYYFVANTMYLWPNPGVTSGRFTLAYLRQSAAITETSPESAFLIPKQYHRIIVYAALQKLYDMEDDPEMAARFGQLMADKLESMRTDMWKREWDRPDFVHVYDFDSYDWEYNF